MTQKSVFIHPSKRGAVQARLQDLKITADIVEDELIPQHLGLLMDPDGTVSYRLNFATGQTQQVAKPADLCTLV